jgi:hypothetical protein
MRLPSIFAGTPLYAFFFKGMLWLVVLTALWAPVADWTMRPAASTAYFALKTAFPWWVRSGKYEGDSFELETRVQVPAQNAPPGTVAILIADAKPAHYGFGLPMLLALLLSSGSRRLVRNMSIGVVCLIPFQAFGIFFDLLKQVAITAGRDATAQIGLVRWQLDVVGLLYQLGVLLIPALTPVVIWLFLERPFLTALIADGQLRRKQESNLPPPDPSQPDVAAATADAEISDLP